MQQLLTAARKAYYRLLKPRDYWHNRLFHPHLDIEEASPQEVVIRWNRRRLCVAKPACMYRASAPRSHIVASGPSIKSILQPARLFDAPTICVNGSYRIAEAQGHQADFYMVSDSTYTDTQFPLFCRGTQACDALLLNAVVIDSICRQDPDVLRGKTVYYYHDLRTPFRRNRVRPHSAAGQQSGLLVHPHHDVAFSSNPDVGIYPSQTVVYNAVQFALGTGFEEINIFGMDLNGSRRFFQEATPPPSHLDRTYEESIKPGFELVRLYLEGTRKRVLNCSPLSRLPACILPKADPNLALKSPEPATKEVTRVRRPATAAA